MAAHDGASSPSSAGILALCALPLAFAIHMAMSRRHILPSGTLPRLLMALVGGASFIWSRTVSRTLSEPYLDEVFHIPQAQRYCEGRFREWDDKLTTPPGLYMLSILPAMALKLLGVRDWGFACSAGSLRAFNGIGLFAVVFLAFLCRRRIEQAAFAASTRVPVSEYAFHTAANIALFPLLFFFSGLYYTDVLSTAVVAGALLNHLGRVARRHTCWVSDVATIFIGILALLMRQTNIIYVVVYMGGLEATHAVKTLRPERAEVPRATTWWQCIKFLGWRYSLGDVHDPSLSQAWPDDMFLTTISLGVAVVCNPLRVVRQIWPYLAVLAAFGAFVAWNGSVVLGDKTNHVATIHLAQMLYVWPLFAFFSLPLFLPMLLATMMALKALFVREASMASGRNERSESTRPAQSSTAVDIPPALRLGIWLMSWLGTLALSGLVVRFNTIIHPFTLADNRHYMFYIFRYTIRRSLLVRYLLIAPYTLSRWMVWGTLAGCSDLTQGLWPTCSPASLQAAPPAFHEEKNDDNTDTVPSPGQAPEAAMPSNPLACSTSPVPTSTALIFLVATSLSLVTAPLVEPRYFIMPWLLWRLLVPAWRADGDSTCAALLRRAEGSRTGRVAQWLARRDARLCLETAWFAAINLVTCCVFISRPFVWRADDGAVLDDGRLQRFMW